MAFTIRLTNITGVEQLTQVENTTSIVEFKNFLKNLYLTDDVYIFKNSCEIKEGTIESNRIQPMDTINVICKLKAGCDIPKTNEIKLMCENQIKSLAEWQSQCEYHSESYLESLHEMSEEIKSVRELTEEDYEREDMRQLFQRRRDQIEDEYNKMKRREKENERTKNKLEELRYKINLKKNKNNKTILPKKTFCGFKKGFLI